MYPVAINALKGAFALSRRHNNPSIFRKELAYPGKFAKVDPDTGETEFELEVDEPLMDHWIKTFKKMNENGIDVPVPLGHTTNAEFRRGTVIDIRKEPSEAKKGQPGLFAYVKFGSPKMAAQFAHSNVSLFMPPDFVDGMKRKYVRPIRHVAITDYPVIPGLGKFTPVAAAHKPFQVVTLSLVDEDSKMTIAELAEKLGVQIPEGADDDAAADAIQEAWTAGEGEEAGDDEGAGFAEEDELEDEEMGLGDLEEEDEELPMAEDDEEDEEDMYGFEDIPEEEEEEVPPGVAFGYGGAQPVAASLVRMVRKARATQINDLVYSGKITKPVADALKQLYATNRHVEVAMSYEQAAGSDAPPPDDFENVCKALSLNASVIRYGERTGAQMRVNDRSPIITDAEARAKKAQRR